MIIHDVGQGSVDWLNARAGIITASELDAVLSAKTWEPRDSKGVKTYVARKSAERWLGRAIGELDGKTEYKGGALEQGNIKEDTAIPWYEFLNDVKLERIGFITTDDGIFGCSPDGMFPGHTSGIEIKCPYPETQAKYLLAGGVPEEYLHQVHGCMAATGADKWHFVSYHPVLPKLSVIVSRDEWICGRIIETVRRITDQIDAAYDVLCSLGKPPPRYAPPPRTPDSEGLDIAGQGITL